ncbi:MAG: PIN domain-containing protein [Deltaproteobacteria bacterium]|nr:PIN domain-containing protein [Deltaproteobacteria bacterium]
MASIIVDTSVWIDFFRGSLPNDTSLSLSTAIRERQVAITDIIRHEILVGARNERDYSELQALLSPLHCHRIQDQELADFDRFAWNLKTKGFRGKYTDASIAYLAHTHQCALASFDHYFKFIEKLGLIQMVAL